MKLTVNENGVFLDGQKIPKCVQIDIKNINPIDGMKAALHVEVNEVDVQWAVKE